MTLACTPMLAPHRGPAYSQIGPQISPSPTEDAKPEREATLGAVRRMVAHRQPRSRTRAHHHLGRATPVEHVRLRCAELAHDPPELVRLQTVDLGARVVLDRDQDQVAAVRGPADRGPGRQMLLAVTAEAPAGDATGDDVVADCITERHRAAAG